MINWLKKLGIGLSQEEKNKKRLKALLEEMLELAKKGEDEKKIREISDHLFKELFLQIFKKPWTEEALNYDRTRNEILMSFGKGKFYPEDQKEQCLKRAQQYIDLL